ncbi:MAG TPA: MFS transporter [Ktedonobacteraceae bacterium]|nr:MFS transporter [Ktedonobacteraceae bacterium]
MDVEEEEFSSISQSHMPVSPLRVVIPALIVQFAFGVSYTWGAVVPYVRAQDHWSPLVISAVFSGVSSGYGTGMIIGGWLADRYPPRLLCWIALGLLSLGYAIAFLFPSGFTFFTFYSFLALGIGGAIVLAGLLAAGASVLPRRIGTIGGALTGSYAFAAVILVPVVSQLAAAFGWINALRLLGSCMAVLAAAALLFIPPIPRPRYREHTRATRGASPLQLLLRKPIWTALLLEITTAPLGAYAFVVLSNYARGLHFALWIATLSVSGAALGSALGRLSGGAASDRFGINRVFASIFAAVLLSAVLLLNPVNGFVILLAALIAGLGFGGGAGVLSRLAAGSAPDAPNSAFGLLFAGYAAGTFFGPILGAAVGGPPTAWFVLAGISVIGLLILVLRTVMLRR